MWGSGPSVVLVHGWNGSAAQMTGFVAPLVSAGYRVVAYDQPAHGHSSGREATLVHFREAVQAIAEYARQDSLRFDCATGPAGDVAAIIGHSLGATGAALAVSARVRVGRLVLLAAPAEVRYFAAEFTRRLGMPRRRTAGLLARIEARVGQSVDAFDLRLLGPTQDPALGGHATPLLVMHDAQDREVPFAHGAAVAAAWLGASFVPLEGLGHTRLLADATVISRTVGFVVAGELLDGVRGGVAVHASAADAAPGAVKRTLSLLATPVGGAVLSSGASRK